MSIQNSMLNIPLHKMNIHKFIILTLKKLELGHVLSSTLQLSNNLELMFDTSGILNGSYSAIYNDNNQRCKVYSVTDTDKKGNNILYVRFSIIGEVSIDRDMVDNYYPYITKEHTIPIKNTFQLKLLYNDFKFEINNEHIKKIQSAMIIFQKYNTYYNVYKYFCSIERTSLDTVSLERKSILQFQKNSKYLDFFEKAPEFPTMDKLKAVIDIIVKNGKTLRELGDMLTVKFSNFTIMYNWIHSNKRMKIVIKIGSFIMFSGYCIETFKYIFHPGLYTFIKYLDISNNITNLDLTIQKQLFKKV